MFCGNCFDSLMRNFFTNAYVQKENKFVNMFLDQIFYCPTNVLNYINCRVIKSTLKCKSCSNMFRFTQKPSSGSQSQCLAKITGMIPQCLSICALSFFWRHIPTCCAWVYISCKFQIHLFMVKLN